jgi:hypothetical protein
MNESLISYIRYNSLSDYFVLLDKDMGRIKCPRLCELGENFLYHNYRLNIYVDIYDSDKDKFLYTLINNLTLLESERSNNILDFAEFAKSFFYCSSISISNELDIIYFINIDEDKENIIGQLNKDNISIFMDAVKIMHHLEDDYLDEVECLTDAAKELMERTKRNRKKARESVKKKDGIGVFEIKSSVCVRSPSYNLLNIENLNYFQLIDQFQMLSAIDSYEINTIALATGNLSEEGRKDFKHYTAKVDKN